MTGSVGEHAAKSSQGSRKGAMRARITALEEAYEECQLMITGGEVENLAQRVGVDLDGLIR